MTGSDATELTEAQYTDAASMLLPAAYDRLKALAAGVRGGFFAVETMNTTALVHEAYLRLDQHDGIDRPRFFALCAKMMRNILIDHVRRKHSQKRSPVPSEEWDRSGEDELGHDFLLSLDQSLERLERINPRLVQVVECRYFAGYTTDETAEYLEVNEKTVRRDWTKARAMLRRFLDQG